MKKKLEVEKVEEVNISVSTPVTFMKPAIEKVSQSFNQENLRDKINELVDRLNSL